MPKPLDHSIVEAVARLSDGNRTSTEISQISGIGVNTVRSVLKRHMDIPRPGCGNNGHSNGGPKRQDWQSIIDLCDGTRSASKIAEILGCSLSLVHKVMIFHPEISRRSIGSPGLCLADNPNFQGVEINQHGYAAVPAPEGHPHAGKKSRMFLHRVIVEHCLGFYLDPSWVIDHMNACRLDNRPDNLKIYETNAEHLKDNLGGKPVYPYQHPKCPHTASFLTRLKRGDVRARQIAHAHELLPKDVFDLLRTERYTMSKSAARRALQNRPTPLLEDLISAFCRPESVAEFRQRHRRYLRS